MAVKPRLVLVDAGAVIHAHRCGGWAQLCKSYEVIVPTIVVGEATFYLGDDRKRIPIDIAPDIVAGRVVTYSASASDFAATSAALPASLRVRVHDGELEALTLLRISGTKETALLTADGGAVEATVVFGFSEVAMSLQRALQLSGMTKALPYEHTEAFIVEAKRRGGVTLAQIGPPPAVPTRKRGRRGS